MRSGVKFIIIFSFLLVVGWPWPPVAKATDIGISQSFFVNTKYDRTSRNQLTASLRLVGQHAKYFVEDTVWQGLTLNEQTELERELEHLSQEFDQRIYPVETGFWGSEPNPGLDGDPHLFILISDLADTAGGYFDTSNQYPRQLVPESNEHEMIVLSSRVLAETGQSFPLLAHEFQHMISFYQRNFARDLNDDVWLNEMRSEYSVSFLGYNAIYRGSNLQRRLASWLADPSDSLTEWRNKTSDYAQIVLFSEYLAEQFGPTVLRDTLRGTSTGMLALNNALAANGSKLNASDVFMRWSIANLVNNFAVAEWSGYKNENIQRALPVSPTRILNNLGDSGEYVFQENFSDWQAKWLALDNLVVGSNNTLQVDLTGEQLADFRLAVVLYKNSQPDTVKFYNLTNLVNPSIYLQLDPGVNKVVLIPAKFSKLRNFTDHENAVPLTLRIKRILDNGLVTPDEAVSPITTKPVSANLIDGSLIRVAGDSKIYLYQNGYRRWIHNEKIFRFYDWSFAQVIDLDQTQIEKIPESNLIQLMGDKKVYQLDVLGRKHWLKMSGEKFIASGRNFSAVFSVNKKEFDLYKLSTNFF